MISGIHTIRVGGILDISTVDWRGNVSLVVFFSGCNFRCPYCHNSSLLSDNSGKEINLEILKKRIEMNHNYIDSVVFSGGELLLQSEGVLAAAMLVKKYSLKLMLDTNGSLFTAAKRLIESGLVDRVALDIKGPLIPHEYQKIACSQMTGIDIVNSIKQTIKLCNFYDIELEARTTIVPNFSDNSDFIRKIASDLKGKCDVYYLQQFDNSGDILNPEFKSLLPPTREKLLELAKIAISENMSDVYIKTRKYGIERVG